MALCPRVSVILPAFNALPHLQSAFDSLLRQTFGDFELIVGDDGSTDGTRERLDALTDPRVVRSDSQRNQGSLRTRNRLLGLARGEFVVFQDADDESLPHRLETLLKAFDREPRLGLVGSNGDYIDRRGRFLSKSNRPLTTEAITATAQQGNPFIFASLMVRRGVLDQVGGFREYFWDLGNYDVDWALRVAERAPCVNLSESLVRVRLRWGSNSLTVGNPRKLLADQLVRFLAKERRMHGADSLDEGRFDRIEEFFRPLEIEFARQPSRPFREMAGELSRRSAPLLALRAALAAIRAEPLRPMNYRALGFVLRNSLGS